MKKAILVLLLVGLSTLPTKAQDSKIFLPLVNAVDNSQQAIVLPCTNAEMAALNKPDDRPMPDNPTDKGCLLPSETFTDGMHTMQFDDQIQAAAKDYWTWPRKVVLYRLNCSLNWPTCGSANGLYIEGALGLFPARGGILPSGGSWSNYFVGNWVSVGPTGTAQCPGGPTTRPHVLIGIGQGRFSSSYYSATPKIFAEKYDTNGCTTFVVTSYNPAISDIHHLQVYQNNFTGGNGSWTARYWHNNQWYYIWTNQDFEYRGEYLMIGGEVGATTLAKAADPIVDLQYISKIRLKLDAAYGWRSYMETNIIYFNGATTKQADSPITMLDWNTGLNFTSMAWEMNPSN